MPRNQRSLVGMNILRPLCRVAIRTIPDVGKEAEFQMIVCVDQPRKQQEPRQVNRSFRTNVRPIMPQRPRSALDGSFRP